MSIEQLRLFLVAANQAGYASSGDLVSSQEPDQSKTITFAQGTFRSHDNYFGGEPYGGRMVVFYKDDPVWMMVYYGEVALDLEDFVGVYGFLQESLKLQPQELPLRGPKSHRNGDYEYSNTWQGSLTSFSGHEVITHKGREIYQADYRGGLINVRKE